MSRSKVRKALETISLYCDSPPWIEAGDYDWKNMSADDIWNYMNEDVRRSFLYPSYGDVGLYNIKDGERYALDKEYLFEVSYYNLAMSDEEDEFDLDRVLEELGDAVEALDEAGVPLATYENSNPDGYILWISIFKPVGGGRK